MKLKPGLKSVWKFENVVPKIISARALQIPKSPHEFTQIITEIKSTQVRSRGCLSYKLTGVLF
jgi:hypothetical protein